MAFRVDRQKPYLHFLGRDTAYARRSFDPLQTMQVTCGSKAFDSATRSDNVVTNENDGVCIG